MVKLKNPWHDGRDCSVFEDVCAYRPCLNIGENKGSFTQGVGYTHYYEKPQLVCMTRHCRGCPHPLPDLDLEKVRCCPNPDFAKSRSNRVLQRQKCRTCGSWASGIVLQMIKTLPKFPASRCNHADVGLTEWVGEACWKCPTCASFFDSKPDPHKLGESFEAFSDRKMDEWKKRMRINTP